MGFDSASHTRVGVYVTKGKLKKLKYKKGFDARNLFKASQKAKTILYYFSYGDVNFQNKTIRGTYFDRQKKTFNKKVFPYPHVLYARVRGIEGKKGRRLRRKLTDAGVQSLNAKNVFDKWRVHQRFLRQPEMQPHLPLTRPFRKAKDLQDMLDQCDQVYIKPRIGKGGQHIVRITKRNGGGYEYCSFQKQVQTKQVNTFKKLVQKVRASLKGKKALIQEAINGLTVGHKMIDMRAEIQRNGKGELEVVGIYPRLGANRSPVTNLSSGAKFYRFDDFVKRKLHYSDKDCISFKKRLEAFVLKAHRSMEKVYGSLGETAIDFAVDDRQHPWFIECNATSTKLAFLVSNERRNVVRKAYVNPLEYAKFLHDQAR